MSKRRKKPQTFLPIISPLCRSGKSLAPSNQTRFSTSSIATLSVQNRAINFHRTLLQTLNICTTLPNKPLASFPINHSTQILSPLPNLKRSHSRQQTNFQSQSSKRRIPPPAYSNFHLHAPNSRLFTRKQRGYNENVIVVCIMQRFPECRVHAGDIPGIRWSITRTGTNRGPFSVGRS